MLQLALTWIVMIGAVVVGIAFGGRQSLAQDATDTLTTLVVVGLLAQWLYRDTPGFRAQKFWIALIALGAAMVALRQMVH